MRRWVVLLEQSRLRWGGDLRRAYLFEPLAARTGAVRTGWAAESVRRALKAAQPRGRWERYRNHRPFLASTELLGDATLDAVVELGGEGVVLDMHDEPVQHSRALGIPIADDELERTRLRLARNLETFRLHVVPTASQARLSNLDPARTLIVPNGTDPRHIRPGPFPPSPTVGMMSGAAPQRGIETLVGAVRFAREVHPDLRLILWLVATGRGSALYLERLKEELEGEPFVEVGSAPYAGLGDELARASMLVVPHPPDPYYDTILPIKVLDSMAAGRPLIVTPRTETAAVVRRWDAGLVTAGDAEADLASAILELIAQPERARALAANGRRAAESEFDWQTLGTRLAEEVLRRVG